MPSNSASPPSAAHRSSGARVLPLAAAGVAGLGGAQIDRFANLNTTVVGDYQRPSVRLPGGGAPEIASQCGPVFITMTQTARAFVSRLDFITSMGTTKATIIAGVLDC